MTNEEMIEAIKANYPTSNYTMLREALDKSIELLEEDAKEIPEYSQRESIKFIMSEMGDNVYPKFVKTILDLDEDYMRSKGIIED